MSRRLISTGSRFEAEIGYSRAVVQGDWCFLSGVTGYDYATMTLEEGMEAQAETAFDTVDRVLIEAGFGLLDVVRVVHYVSDRDDIPMLLPVLSRRLHRVRPASTMLVAGLMEAAMLYEVEVTALRA
jgi:enamine deaminase RidA (YjgF/YER057c/UK114 family)